MELGNAGVFAGGANERRLARREEREIIETVASSDFCRAQSAVEIPDTIEFGALPPRILAGE